MTSVHQQHEILNMTKWIEKIFRRSWLSYNIGDIVTDFSKGVIIIHLVKALAQRMLPVLCPKPKTLEQKVGNIEIALQAFKEDGVECPGIFASDIANGDCEIIITFCYMLKHHYSQDEAGFYGSGSYHQSTLLELDEKDFSRRALPSGSSPKDSRQLQAPASFPGFLPYDKEDIAVFQWVSSQVGVPIDDYHVFRDGVLLCKLVNKVSVRKIPEKVISNSSKLDRVKLALRFAAHELGVRVRLEPNDVISGKERIALRGYICLLKRIKSKQDQLMTYQLRSLDQYSDLVDSIGFSKKASQRPSVANLLEPVYEDLCKSISRSALYKKLAHSRSLQVCDASNDAFIGEAVNPYSMKGNEPALEENFRYSRNRNEGANVRWKH